MYSQLAKEIYLIKVQNRMYLSQILSLTELGRFKVKCYLPLSLSQRAGVIGPFGMNTKAEEIVQELKVNGSENVKVERLLKRIVKSNSHNTNKSHISNKRSSRENCSHAGDI